MLVTWLLFAALVAYNIVDVWQTYLLIGLGAYEANPLVATFISCFGVLPGLCAMKALWLTIIFVLLINLHLKNNKKEG